MRINEFTESQQSCPECGGPAFSNLLLAEKQDACYNKVKSRYKVWPSAYASGALVQCRKKGAANWGNKSEGVAEGEVVAFPKKHKGDLTSIDDCPKCGGDLQGGKYQGHEVKVCMPCKQVYLPPNSGIDQQGNKIKEQGVTEGLPQTLRKVVPGYAKREIDKKMDAEKFGRTDVDRDANFQRYKKIQDKIKGQGVAEGSGFDKWADDRAASQLHKLKPGMVQDRKTGKWYDPKKEFDKKMNSPEVMAQMKRMAQKEGVAEDLNDTQKKIEDTINKLEDRLKHAKSDEQWDRISARIERLQAGLKRSKQGVAEGLPKDTTPKKKVQDRKTGEPDVVSQAKFAEIVNRPKMQAAMKRKGMAEDYNPEYDDEAGMAQGSLHTLKNAVEGLQDVIDAGDNLPEWCQEKISLAEDYLVTVWDYIQSEKAQGIDPEISEEFDMIERIIESIAAQNGVDAEAVWTDLESLTEDELYAFAVTSQLNEDWSKVNKKDKTDGMSSKAVKAYRRENPGSKLKTAVTTKPSKLKKGSKASKRRKSYCSRSKGQMNMHNISCAKTPDKAICKARRRWNC